MMPCRNSSCGSDIKGKRNVRMRFVIPRVFAAEKESVEKKKITAIQAIKGSQTRLLEYFDGYNDILFERNVRLLAPLADIDPVFLPDALVIRFAVPFVWRPKRQQNGAAVH